MGLEFATDWHCLCETFETEQDDDDGDADGQEAGQEGEAAGKHDSHPLLFYQYYRNWSYYYCHNNNIINGISTTKILTEVLSGKKHTSVQD